MNSVKIVDTLLKVEDITQEVASQSCGAISVFIGTTRDNFDGKKVLRLEYEAYTPMAIQEMKKICNEIREKWEDVENIAMHHRTGLVPLLEASIIIAISSPHRASALNAVEYAINTLKARVPIWKKEVYEDENSQWKENKECFWQKQN